MENCVYGMVRECQSRAENRGTIHRHQKQLKLVPANGPIAFVTIDILGTSPKKTKDNQFVLVITDIYSKMTLGIPLTKTTGSHVADAFLDNWIKPYGIPKFLLSDNVLQFVSNLFD